MIRILSTKKLLPNQKQFLLNAGFSVIEADFIHTQNIGFEIPPVKDNLIFTSQNAVKSILDNQKGGGLKQKNCFCVGTKTKQLLLQNGFDVIVCADYATDLADIISNDYPRQSFTFFSGNLRQDTLPDMLKDRELNFNEVTVYKTVLTPNKINIFIDGILFFSPSGVESYLIDNSLSGHACFCIGTTTARALENKTENVIIANQPSVENVIIQTIKYYNKE